MFLHNIITSKYLYNGTRLIVTQLHQNYIRVYIIKDFFNDKDSVFFQIKMSTQKRELP